MKDIDELTRMMKEMEEQMGVNKKDMAEMGDIASIKFIPPKAVDNLRTFTLLLGDEEINLDNIQKGLTLIPGQMKDWTGATEAHVATQDTMNVGSETYIAKLELMKQRIAELRAEEIKRNDILSDINMEEVLRQERIDALIILEKMEADEIARANQLMDDQIARMENAATASAGMRIETDKVTKSTNEMASGILLAAGAMKVLTDSTATGEQKAAAFLRTIGGLLMMLPGGQVPGAVLQAGSSFIGHTGGLVQNNGIQRFAQGGMVQGQDNVPIMAQAGEFIMRREAVQNIGVQNLAQMNKTGQGGITLNISAPLVDETVVDAIIPAIQKAQRMNLA